MFIKTMKNAHSIIPHLVQNIIYAYSDGRKIVHFTCTIFIPKYLKFDTLLYQIPRHPSKKLSFRANPHNIIDLSRPQFCMQVKNSL